jgi:3,5-epimerase/4-reductase
LKSLGQFDDSSDDAGMMINLLKSSGKEFYLSNVRCENRESVKAELLKIKPTHVLNAAGVTGTPNVDWCEFNQEAALRSNILGSMTVSFLDMYCMCVWWWLLLLL